ncbi:proton-coupled folate transporter-like isoform X1 [Pectinophora gossypiella]|uniref:proton-coupled folate transporter-like isoform X1 n=1 Tax=Pectinophora gossypiella TaxID=13191 RepID=UPI00214E4642|nr:proton-coupled folate transporter-like isoform X1 [Pectinophora gossypiella]
MESTLDLPELEKLRKETSEKDESKESSTDKQRKWKFLLEPALVGAMMAINLGQTSLQNFYLRTACSVDLGNSLELCESVHGGQLEADSQRVVSGVNISRSFVGSLIATAVLLFVGPWSDCSGRRKPLLILPLVGMSVMTIGVLLMLTFPGASTVQVLYAVQIPISMGGNFGLLLAAAFSHIGDVCHASGRDVTRTMGTHRAAIQVAHVVGSVSGPLLFRNFGYYGVFPIVLLLQLSSLVYVIFAMEDVNVNTENKVSVCNWKLPFNAISCLLRKREGRKRFIILLMLVVALGDRMLLSAEVLLSYMFYRYKFNWDDIMFGSFIAYRNVTSFVGTLLILTILKKRLNLSDEMVGMMSCASYVLATSGLIVASTTFCVFLLPIIGIIAQGSQVVQRPILNKQILPTEQGKIYSVLGALESATQTISSPLYSLLYKKTVANTPDAWLIPGIILAVLQALSYFTTKRLNSNKNPPPVESLAKKNIPLEPIKTSKAEKVEDKSESSEKPTKEQSASQISSPD